jgi:hypothetical protein
VVVAAATEPWRRLKAHLVSRPYNPSDPGDRFDSARAQEARWRHHEQDLRDLRSRIQDQTDLEIQEALLRHAIDEAQQTVRRLEAVRECHETACALVKPPPEEARQCHDELAALMYDSPDSVRVVERVRDRLDRLYTTGVMKALDELEIHLAAYKPDFRFSPYFVAGRFRAPSARDDNTRDQEPEEVDEQRHPLGAKFESRTVWRNLLDDSPGTQLGLLEAQRTAVDKVRELGGQEADEVATELARLDLPAARSRLKLLRGLRSRLYREVLDTRLSALDRLQVALERYHEVL